MSSMRVFGLTLLVLSAVPGCAVANSVQHGSKAVEHSATASAHASAAVVTGAASVAAVPLMAAGEVGKAAGTSGRALWDSANQPLPVTRETVTRHPVQTKEPAEPIEPPPSTVAR